ncbi:XrtB/PEP-CTERM-associated transcriptional regulator EpsA [Nitrosomonas oligotropha]|uniref:Transcriptional regulator, LuxR family n=1 Tax=Nitrosomonas oligotropha TaxID=42354 RepID=A0A1H8LNV6_9PROT|nr:XrtB/PEP-CTERM-associated transcriptional regulator EpsA [Nitrosomonas oligotropha]SDW41778.1 transcriptional regulator, LuxR family [Nitrosomonas oligotropha]SEO06703.1 transcriptional regulator, LuxR family [Nitrosomonas oligotropha]
MNALPSVFDGSLELYFNVVREGIAVRSHYDLLKWLQGDVQRYLPHKIMLAVWMSPGANPVEYDVVSVLPGVRTGFLHSERLLTLQRELYSLWITSGNAPYRQSLDACDFRCGDSRSLCSIGEVCRSMRSLLVHGVSDERAGRDCLYIIFSANDSFDAAALSVMENLLPYLDTALRRITPLVRQREVALPPADLPQSRKKYGLSMRETEILDWVRLGKTNSEIACILEISAYTVKNHLQSIFRKLDVFNRVQAITKVGPAPVIVNPASLFPPATTSRHRAQVRSIKQLS